MSSKSAPLFSRQLGPFEFDQYQLYQWFHACIPNLLDKLRLQSKSHLIFRKGIIYEITLFTKKLTYISKVQSILLFTKFGYSVSFLHFSNFFASSPLTRGINWFWQRFNKFNWRRFLRQNHVIKQKIQQYQSILKEILTPCL